MLLRMQLLVTLLPTLGTEMVRKRKLTEDQTAELQALHQKCNVTIRFLNRRGELGDIGRQFEEVIQQTYEEQNLRGMRMLGRDLNDWSKDLRPEERRELEAILSTELGVEADRQGAADETELRKIEARSRITNEREYSLVQARLEELRETSASSEEAQRLAALLASY